MDLTSQIFPRLSPYALRDALSTHRLRVVCSGSDDPVIDLSIVSEELASECSGVDLVILEGMGR